MIDGEEVRKTYVELLYPGSFMPEESVHEVRNRNPRAIARKYPKAFAFKFYDRIEKVVEVGGQRQRVATNRLKETGRYYPKAIVLTQADIEREMGQCILLSNMQCNNWKKVVRCHTGNYQPLEKNDVVL